LSCRSETPIPNPYALSVALLWKAPNESGGDMSELLFVDHRVTGAKGKLDYSLDNLRFLTTTQNTKCKKPRK
jgi:hypothetical protein